MKYENCSQLLWPLKPFPHPTEMNTLLSDSLEMDLLIENLIVKLQRASSLAWE